MIEVRNATKHDQRVFLVLWREYLEECRKMGSEIQPTVRTMNFFGRLFFNYVHKIVDGICLIAGDADGVLFWGLPLGGLPFDTDFGRTAQGWGTYVRPLHRREGISLVLREEAKRELARRGFDSVLGTVLDSNRPGRVLLQSAGFTLYSRIGILRLR